MEIVIQSSKELDHYLLSLFKKFQQNGIKDFFIPAGGTPEDFYQLLCDHYDSLKKEGFDKVKLWQIDEIISGEKQDYFYDFFQDKLGPWITYLQAIRKPELPPKAPFVSLLGLGINGHVAFHEPHIPYDFGFGCVELGQETCDYLDLEMGTWGLTYGLKTFLNSENIVLIVKGQHKAQVLQRFMEDDETLPAVALKNHPGLILLADELAFSNFKNKVAS
jgi:glucosamine-6-phosphate deaminase